MDLGRLKRDLPSVGRPNGGRLGNRKERTGCKTCKKRKIKCDEGKPVCHRCSSTGRTCDGYTTPEFRVSPELGLASVANRPSRTPSPLSEGFLFTTLASDPEEHRALSYFTSGGALQIAGAIDLGLWARLIPQLSHRIPSVKHATISIGSLLLQAVNSRSGAVRDEAEQTFALWHYQRAIQTTLDAIADGHGDPLLAAVTCVLFFCIEALQGHEHEALQLYERGRRGQLTLQDVEPRDEICADVMAMFTRLGIQWSMFEANRLDEIPWSPRLEGPIESVAQASKELTPLLINVMRLGNTGIGVKWGFASRTGRVMTEADIRESLKDLRVRRIALESVLQDWHTRFLAFKDRNAHRLDDWELTAPWSLLLVRYRGICLWLYNSTDRAETIYDDHLSDFEDLITEADVALKLLNSVGCQAQQMAFTFELGFIPPLYIAIQKCRDPALRRRALSILRRAPAQEGLWNRDIVIRVAERVIELEEGSDGFIEHLPASLIHMKIPEEMRCKLVRIGTRTTNAEGIAGDYVEFWKKPYGYEGAWAISHEFFTATTPVVDI